MRAIARLLLPLVLLPCLCGAPALAQTPAPAAGGYQEKLKTYDPAAVAAAESYAKTFNMRGMMEKSAPGVVRTLSEQMKAKNPGLTDAQSQKFFSLFTQNFLSDSSEVVEHAMILQMLDVFSKEELVAVDTFYSSPLGVSVLKKMPVLMGHMPHIMEMMQSFIIPRALDAAKEQMRKDGVEVKI